MSKTEYNKQYDEQHTTQLKLKLNNNTDKDILDKLDNIGKGKKQTYIKELIRKDIKG